MRGFYVYVMPDLLLPSLPYERVSPDSILPTVLHQFQLQGTVVRIINQKWGSAFLQEVQVNGFAFGYQIFQVYQPATIPFTCHSGSGIFHYMMKGNLNILQEEPQLKLLLEELHYCLGNHPPGSQLQVALKPGEHHYFQLAFSTNFLKHLLHSLPESALSSEDCQPKGSSFQYYTLPILTRLAADISSIFKHSLRPVNNFLYLNDLALQLTNRFINDTRTYIQKRYWEQKKQLLLEEMEAYILDHLDTESKKAISLTACARKTGMSTFYFKKLFRQQYGFSHAAYTHKKRMEKAIRLITESSLPAGDIYQQIGYEDFSSFTRAFRSYYGHPPSYFRNT